MLKSKGNLFTFVLMLYPSLQLLVSICIWCPVTPLPVYTPQARLTGIMVVHNQRKSKGRGKRLQTCSKNMGVEKSDSFVGCLDFKWVQFSSVTQSCPTVCDSMDCSMPSLPVHHQLVKFTQTHAHWVSDAMQPSHPHHSLLLPP